LCVKICPSLSIGQRDTCFQCGSNLFQGKTPKKSFFSVPLSTQLVYFFANRSDLIEQIDRYYQRCEIGGSEKIQDFLNGEWTKKNKCFLSYKWNLAIGICLDGIPAYQSSKISLWPVFCVILNLPPEIRYKVENILMISCSTNPRTPEEYKAICSMIVYEANALYKGVPVVNCIDSNHKTLKAKISFITCDLEAKNKVMNMVGYSGYYGCYYCLIKGENQSHVYFPGPPGEKRTNLNLLSDSAKSEHGVKELTEIFQLSFLYDNFNTVLTFPIDIMHCIFLGVTKRITNLWLTSDDIGFRHQISSVEEFGQSLSNKSRCFSRPLRVFSQIGNWKAVEWKNWLFYYSPVILPSYLSSKYLMSYLQFSKSIFSLCSTNLSLPDLEHVHNEIQNFVTECETLYGISFCSLNVHLLHHLVDFVKEYGPLWVYWCFPFEKALGYYKKFLKSQKSPAKSFCRVSSFQNFSSSVSSTSINPNIQKVLSPTKNFNKYLFSQNSYLEYETISQIPTPSCINSYFRLNSLECFAVHNVVYFLNSVFISIQSFTPKQQIAYLLF